MSIPTSESVSVVSVKYKNSQNWVLTWNMTRQDAEEEALIEAYKLKGGALIRKEEKSA